MRCRIFTKKLKLPPEFFFFATKIKHNIYRPQTKFSKVMFSQVFDCPRRGVSVSVGGGLCQGDPPPPYGNRRAVRILLECILVHWMVQFFVSAADSELKCHAIGWGRLSLEWRKRPTRRQSLNSQHITSRISGAFWTTNTLQRMTRLKTISKLLFKVLYRGRFFKCVRTVNLILFSCRTSWRKPHDS